MVDERLIWCAGFFDGEGCIGAYGYNLQVTVGQKYREPLEVFLDVLQRGSIVLSSHTYVHYVWTVSGRKAGYVLEQMLPYLVLKRPQAVLGVEFASTIGTNGHSHSMDVHARREQISQELKQLKHK
jgi:hypothetical protein